MLEIASQVRDGDDAEQFTSYASVTAFWCHSSENSFADSLRILQKKRGAAAHPLKLRLISKKGAADDGDHTQEVEST